MKTVRNVFLALFVIGFVASLFLPAYEADSRGYDGVLGWFALVFGGFGLIGSWSFPWLANPLALTTFFLIFEGEDRRALITAVLAFAASLGSFYYQNMDLFPLDGGMHVRTLGLGFYVWAGSLFSLVIATIVNGLKTAPSHTPVQGGAGLSPEA